MAVSGNTESMDLDILDGQRPYKYQEEIFRHAQKGNVIAAMNTGSGKTLISALLIKWIAVQKKAEGKAVIFLVPKVTLVKQQASYLKMKANLKIAELHGALDLDLSDRVGWKNRFEKHNVLVMTAQIFLNILTHSLWSFDKVSLIVFDECHHARKNHPYNGILREYFQIPPARRPKVFGMTASPIWNIKDPHGSLAILEANMDAKVIGVREHVQELDEKSPKPQEIIREFPSPLDEYQRFTPTVFQCLRVIDKVVWEQMGIPWSNLEMRYHSTFYNIGPYGASLFLYHEVQLHIERALVENKKHFYDALDDLQMDLDGSHPTRKELPGDISLIIEILHGFEGFFPPTSASFDIPIDVDLEWCTPKVRVLAEILLEYYTPVFQCIIFVEQRQVVSTLAKILPAIPRLKGLIRSAHIVGSGVNSEGITKQTDQFHGDAVKLFREKSVNILIATSVAEEGLDFQACDLVIRFDQFHHMVGYVQSRGRARNKASTFVVMIQHHDDIQLARYRALQDKEPEVNHAYQTRHVEIDTPEENDSDEETHPVDLLERERYVVPSTGAILTYDNSLSLLGHLCSLIPRDGFTPVHLPKYTGNFEQTLRLPPALPLLPIHLVYSGPPKRSKKEAKRAVAFLAVKRLLRLNVLNDYLLPVERGANDDGDDEQDSELEKRRHNIPAMMNVAVRDPWCISRNLWLHPVVINGIYVAGLVTGTDFAETEILTRGSHVQLLPGKLLSFDKDSEHEHRIIMNDFTRFTIFYTITSRSFDHPVSLYLVPITQNHTPDFQTMTRFLSNPRGCNDWSQISEHDHSHLLVVNRYRAGGVYLLRNIRPDLSPLSTPAPGSRESSHSTYHEYWVHKWSRKKEVQIPSQSPLLEVIRLVRSNSGSYELDPVITDAPSIVPNGCLLPRSTCLWIYMPPSLRQAYEILPALCHRITDTFRARAGRSELGLPLIGQNRLIEAFTIPSANAPHNNQRLETLGDAVLQVCTTVHLLNEYPNRHEGQLTALRKKYVSNQHLLRVAIKIGLDRFVMSEIPVVHTWRYVMPGKSHFPQDQVLGHTVIREYPRRSLQDCMEATLGASFLTGGIPLALRTGTALGMEFGGSLPWNIRYQTVKSTDHISALFLGLEDNLGYKFKRNKLLLEALTHPSFAIPSEGPSYQRLEFLGDAILDLVVIDYLYNKFPVATSHQLALPRTKAICAQTLANVAVRRLGLHRMMLYNSSELNVAIDRYIPILQSTSGEEIVHRGWKFDPPKALSDIFESIIGAVLVDSGYDYEKTAAVVEYVMDDVLEALSPSIAKDPVSKLMEWKAGAGCSETDIFKKNMRKTDTWEREGIAVILHGVLIVGPIVSASLSVAKFIAAEKALAVLEDPTSEKALSSLCDCGKKMDTRSDSPDEGNLSDLEDAQEVEFILTDESKFTADMLQVPESGILTDHDNLISY